MYRGVPGAKGIGTKRLVHPAIRHLLPSTGTAEVTFRDPSDDAVAHDHGQARHQAAEPFLPSAQARTSETRGSLQPPDRSAGVTYSKDQLREWGYPEYDPKFDDAQWMKEQFRKEREDPRQNANFFLDPSDPAFFDNASRRPYAKALLNSEEHWHSRKNQWLEQFDNVRLLNESRRFVGASLEQCQAETKRMIAPMMKHRIVEMFLMNVEQRAKELDVPFEEQIELPENKESLQDFRKTHDSSGALGMEDLLRAWEFRATRHQLENEAKEERELRLKGGAVGTMMELKDAMEEASRHKQDGVAGWRQGNTEDAISSWRKGHKALFKVRAPDIHVEENKVRDELHCALLKNLAQAAIKLGHWSEALEAADLAVTLDDEDHKAWFRKACALEGLGRLREVERCLTVIDSIAVGRPDRDRIEHDTQAKRERLRALATRDEASQKRMLQGGVKHAIFSEERHNAPAVSSRSGPPRISHQVAVVSVDDCTRKRLTKEAAQDLLRELQGAYREPAFRKQVRKLALDVNDQGEFIAYLNRVALPVQKPVLERFGFSPNDVGVAEMRKAVQDHTQAKDGDPRLRALAEETMQALYGDFYEVIRGVGLHPEQKLPQAGGRRRRGGGAGDGSSGSDAEGDAEDALPPCFHWTGRPLAYQPGVEEQAAPGRPAAVGRARRGGAAGAGAAAPSRSGGLSGPRPKVSAAERKEIWTSLSAAMTGTDATALRLVVDRAVEAGFSAITIRSAKKRLEVLGGDVSDLP